MKRLLLVLILIVSFQSWVTADDINDFEIEGISLGDTLTSFYTKEKINTQINTFTQYPKSEYFVRGQFYKNLNVFDALIIHVKKNDKKYKIYSVAGVLEYENKKDIKKCYEKMKLINNDIKEMFPAIELRKNMKIKHRGDSTGKSTYSTYSYNFKSGDGILIQCYNWSQDSGFINHLRLSMSDTEFRKWIREEAY
tara:strand:+ start:185 stop:769 length:585 start_codon:yes stop_codon:yes gene_type:complete